MKKRFIVCLGLLLSASCLLHSGDKPELKWKPLTAGFAEAKKNKKKVMVDVYTDWCGWCKRLDKDTYSDGKVIDYLSHEYVVVKLNAESKDSIKFKENSYSGASLAREFGVTGYPTIIFFDSQGEFINSLGGYVNAERFLPIIQYLGGDYYKAMTWKEYEDMVKENTKN